MKTFTFDKISKKFLKKYKYFRSWMWKWYFIKTSSSKI